MPIKRAAYKHIRSSKKKRLRNIAVISAIKTASKKINTLLASKNKENIKSALSDYVSLLDKASQKGIIHRKTASRKIARISIKAHEITKKI